MKRSICPVAVVVLLFALSACAPPPLASVQMMPADAVYGQIDDNHFLKESIIVEEVEYAANRKLLSSLYTEASTSLALVLKHAHYLAGDKKSAKYMLSATIKDIEPPSCLLGSCETGSAVNYVIRDIKRDKVVYEELLVVPYTGEAPVFGADVNVYRAMYGAALGENYAHLLQVLSRKSKADFK